jgi:hypothetical protein
MHFEKQFVVSQAKLDIEKAVAKYQLRLSTMSEQELDQELHRQLNCRMQDLNPQPDRPAAILPLALKFRRALMGVEV